MFVPLLSVVLYTGLNNVCGVRRCETELNGNQPHALEAIHPHRVQR